MWNSRSVKGRPTSGGSGPSGAAQDPEAKRVLVVDDEPGIRLLLSQVLARAGYVVDVASDGSGALRKLEEGAYDTLIIDMKMPGMNGEELYRHLKKVDKLLARRLIFITGDTAGREARDFAAATGNPVIEKPFDLAEVRLQLQSVLGN